MLTFHTKHGDYVWYIGEHIANRINPTKITADGDELAFLIEHNLIVNNKERIQHVVDQREIDNVMFTLKEDFNTTLVLETGEHIIKFINLTVNIDAHDSICGYAHLYKKVVSTKLKHNTYGDPTGDTYVSNELSYVGSTHLEIPKKEITIKFYE